MLLWAGAVLCFAAFLTQYTRFGNEAEKDNVSTLNLFNIYVYVQLCMYECMHLWIMCVYLGVMYVSYLNIHSPFE